MDLSLSCLPVSLCTSKWFSFFKPPNPFILISKGLFWKLGIERRQFPKSRTMIQRVSRVGAYRKGGHGDGITLKNVSLEHVPWVSLL